MTTVEEAGELETRKVEVIRSLCQGYGVNKDTLIERSEELQTLLDGVPSDRWNDILETAFDLMPETPYTTALQNAFFANDEGENLTDRRNRYLKEQGNVTYRTLIRHEQEGAELYLKYLDIAKRFMEKAADGERIDDEDDPDMAVLRSRVSGLEKAVDRLCDIIDAMQRERDRQIEEIVRAIGREEKPEFKPTEITSRTEGALVRPRPFTGRRLYQD